MTPAAPVGDDADETPTAEYVDALDNAACDIVDMFPNLSATLCEASARLATQAARIAELERELELARTASAIRLDAALR